MARVPKSPDPTKDPEFKRVLKNLLNTPHKPQADMKVSRLKPAKKGQPRKAAKIVKPGQ
jgi:hypothetical protein